MGYTGNSIIDHLIQHAHGTPDKIAFVVLEDGETAEKNISYQELERRANRLAVQLIEEQLAHKRVLLVYQDILEFIISFLACQYAGITPVPVPYVKGSKQLARLMNIIADAEATAILCASYSIAYLKQGLYSSQALDQLTIIATDLSHSTGAQRLMAAPTSNEIAFIQYTSGSTGSPKGVMITNKNLLHNQQQIKSAFGCDASSIIFSWLPFHHDMGLIGNILHTIYIGCTAVLMSPFHFIQSPKRWLAAISRYKVTHSGAPNFAYDLCVNKVSPTELATLDLSHWKVAFNGAEPIRWETIQQFSSYFKPAGFQENAFSPCYGLAEATLIVSGYKQETGPLVAIFVDNTPARDGKLRLTTAADPQAKPVVSAGSVVPGMHVKIISTQDLHECTDLEEGEIFIAGDNVTNGYWNKDNSSLFNEWDGQLFLATGDLGFFHKGALFVYGRRKEMLIIRGENFYPYDIEQMIAQSVMAVEQNGVAVFGFNNPEEVVVIVAEIKRSAIKDLAVVSIIDAIDKAVVDVFGIAPYDILLTTPLGIPRTTSGKLQRLKCRDYYVQHTFNVIGSKLGSTEAPSGKSNNNFLLQEAMAHSNFNTIKSYLVDVIGDKVGYLNADRLNDNVELTGLGIDSLRATELINTINKDLNINMDVTKVFQHNTLSGLIKSIENVLWLKNEQTSGEEIII
jgi:acyl-CoA synthetase (AMP-forming)/AMP-acid ligase II/acyl carrier protein